MAQLEQPSLCKSMHKPIKARSYHFRHLSKWKPNCSKTLATRPLGHSSLYLYLHILLFLLCGEWDGGHLGWNDLRDENSELKHFACILLAPGQSRKRESLGFGSAGWELAALSSSGALTYPPTAWALIWDWRWALGLSQGANGKWQYTMVSAHLILPFTLFFCSKKYSNPTFRQRCGWGK